MLARASSDASARLRRSKSTSTVHRHAPPIIEPFDPNVAQQHALAAATAAFARSQAQETIERKSTRSVELSRSKSTASRKSFKSQGSHFPPRELSIRTIPTRNDTKTVSSHPLFRGAGSNTEKSFAFNPTPSSERPSSLPRPLSAQPSITSGEHAHPASQPKPNRQSAASSITSQQIRKARSMYYASSVQTGSPIARPPAQFLTTPPSTSVNPALSTTPAVYVPTRITAPSPLAVPRFPVAVALDDTIDKARDKYLQDFQQRSIKHKPSLFLAPFKKRQEKSKDKVKRMSSTTPILSTTYQATEDPAIDIAVSDFMPKPDAKDGRSFSGSLKRKIKRVFRRSSNKSASLPVQQIEASREYFGAMNPDDILSQMNGLTEIPRPDDTLLQSVRSRTPSLEGSCPYLIRSKSRSSSNDSAHSNRSLHSEASVSHVSASRVTSWGTSASGDTLTQRAIKRLTVIHEAKDSISSIADQTASVPIKRKSIRNLSLSAFKDPMHMESLAEETSTPSVDPKRVFSALMREINASKSAEASLNQADRTPGAESDVFESSKTKELHFTSRELHSSASKDLCLSTNDEKKLSAGRSTSVAAHSIQGKKSSIKLFGRAIRSTIRAVTPGEHRSSPYLDQSITQADADTPSSDTSSSSQEHCERHKAIFKGLHGSKKKTGSVSRDHSIDTYVPTTEQIEIRVTKAKSRWQTPLEKNGTPHFPQETDRLFTVTNFAQRRASTQMCEDSRSPSSSKSPTAQPSNPMQTPLSPSVYSRNTDGMSILPNDSVMSFNSPYEPEYSHNGGSAVILTSQSVRSYIVGTPSPNRPSSTRSSRDWKAWLSHEVSGIETASQEKLTIHERYVSPSGRHTGNLAENVRTSHTGSEDTTVIARGSFDASTPRGEGGKLIIGSPEAVQQIEEATSPEELLSPTLSTIPVVMDRRDRHLDAQKDLTTVPTPSPAKLEQKLELSTTPTSILSVHRDNKTSTPNGQSSASLPALATHGSAHMNERFPFFNTGRRSSSNNSSLSQHTKSPTSSIGSSFKSLKMTPGPKVIYSDLSAPATGSTAHHVPNTAVRRTEGLQSKENVTPPSMGGYKRPHISPIGLVPRPKSLQPLSSGLLNGSSTKMAQYNTDVADPGRSKLNSGLAVITIGRPRLRATIRPLSPEKLSRRPRSAFDLRNTPPPPRPASELHRPALRLKASPRLIASVIEPKFDFENGEHQILSETEEREGSTTPGQRMAECFLKERKSTTVLERGVRKSTTKFLREDTPAFL
ncbi:uncharacterized protein EKO05_0001167 [Ascochyta rabiei]|uniref:uncharacterized protein n=1 Tax=Didymella rabiei TaxID=5454 RepID=UPI002209743B|nr:uncharacterized protein EKO05_0001167 [Ascochyta rabiei]UPX10511.1 hypothetical protein EKO05_0001167 [Ascochyta rabiei]